MGLILKISQSFFFCPQLPQLSPLLLPSSSSVAPQRSALCDAKEVTHTSSVFLSSLMPSHKRDLDKEVEQLRRLPENLVCISCNAVSQFGFGDVCTKFAVFCCTNCKAAHQAFSHRVKSIGQSTWTEADVDALKAGNAAAAKIWLARLPRDQVVVRCPDKGAKPTAWHAWIKEVFEEKAFADADAAPPPPAPPLPSKAAPPAPLIGDLLNLDDEAQGAPAPPPASARVGTDDDDFGEFVSSPTHAAHPRAPPPRAPPPPLPARAPPPAHARAASVSLLDGDDGGDTFGAWATAVAGAGAGASAGAGAQPRPPPQQASSSPPRSLASLIDLDSLYAALPTAPTSGRYGAPLGAATAPPSTLHGVAHGAGVSAAPPHAPLVVKSGADADPFASLNALHAHPPPHSHGHPGGGGGAGHSHGGGGLAQAAGHWQAPQGGHAGGL